MIIPASTDIAGGIVDVAQKPRAVASTIRSTILLNQGSTAIVAGQISFDDLWVLHIIPTLSVNPKSSIPMSIMLKRNATVSCTLIAINPNPALGTWYQGTCLLTPVNHH